MIETRGEARHLAAGYVPESADSSLPVAKRTTPSGDPVGGGGPKRRRRGEGSLTGSTRPTHKASSIPQEATARKAKGKHREFSNFFPAMPLDTLYEILGYLTPNDLLSVARTNHAFKQTLSGPTAKATWIHARGQYGAPSPPLGFNETRWASLLFEHTCMSCRENEVSVVDWLIRKRMCSDCRKTRLAGERTFRGYDIDMFDCIPRTHILC
ncbi:hypothetical protein FA13DRAFT_1778239 [Coprinellus micaceus]|uniref:F-box domain-containing protein n=1 Tax=Coprinellus micaceus TaxID=71717 RepID=A0A4Y7SPP4_COPMI|nr:hypothetical protein FA13DRAFT_1778239 [Coprinellus micaceus]